MERDCSRELIASTSQEEEESHHSTMKETHRAFKYNFPKKKRNQTASFKKSTPTNFPKIEWGQKPTPQFVEPRFRELRCLPEVVNDITRPPIFITWERVHPKEQTLSRQQSYTDESVPSLEILSHATQCDDWMCEEIECKRFKRSIYHLNWCTYKRDTCDRCYTFIALLNEHSIECSDENCPIVLCKALHECHANREKEIAKGYTEIVEREEDILENEFPQLVDSIEPILQLEEVSQTQSEELAEGYREITERETALFNGEFPQIEENPVPNFLFPKERATDSGIDKGRRELEKVILRRHIARRRLYGGPSLLP